MPADIADHPAALSLRGLSKRYGEVVAVQELSLDIEMGEFVTLLGPSGSGKTTTLNMIAGFVDSSGGEILMDGQPIGDLRPHRREIGMVFQDYALFPHMSAFENVAFPLRRRGVPKRDISRRVKEALEMVRLEEFGDRYPRELSGGQQQRVALARVIVFSPKVLLMDEPLGALDKKLREWLQLELKRIHRELGITFVYVTHDQEEALVLSDRVAVFNQGRIEQVGGTRELYEKPASLFVAEFLGDSSLFPGQLASSNACAEVVADGYRIRAPECPGLAEGARGVVVVRPERLSVRGDGDASVPNGDNVVEAAVREVIYLGSARKLELELSDGRLVRATEPAGALSAAKPGDRVRVSWSIGDGVLLPDQQLEPGDL